MCRRKETFYLLSLEQAETWFMPLPVTQPTQCPVFTMKPQVVNICSLPMPIVYLRDVCNKHIRLHSDMLHGAYIAANKSKGGCFAAHKLPPSEWQLVGCKATTFTFICCNAGSATCYSLSCDVALAQRIRKQNMIGDIMS